MRQKDYYSILEISRKATLADIKRAFRQLAMRYHPDKNEGNRLAADKFLDIHEAYRTLSDHGRRTAYDQQWWYNSRQRDKQGYDPESPESVLFRAEKLRTYINSLGNASIDRDALFDYMERLLPEPVVQKFSEPDMAGLAAKLVPDLLQTSRWLRYPQMLVIAGKLTRMTINEPGMLGMISNALKEQRMEDYWRRYQGLIILATAVIICLVIFLTT